MDLPFTPQQLARWAADLGLDPDTEPDMIIAAIVAVADAETVVLESAIAIWEDDR
jgi:hypothetical protein